MDGGIGMMMLAFIAIIAFFAALIPVLLAALLPWRSNPGVWSVAGLLSGVAEARLAVEVRCVSTLADWSEFLLVVAVFCSLGGLVCLVLQKRRENEFSRFLWGCACGVILLVLGYGTNQRAFRIRSEEVLTLSGQREPQKVARLLAAGADPDCFEGFDCGLDRAIANKDWETAKVLIQYGATPTQHNIDGDNEYGSLKLLEQNGQDELARRLRANGEDRLR